MKVDLANYLRKYWLVLVLSGVIAGVVALAITYFFSPAYESTTTVMVMPQNESVASGAMVNPSQVYFGTQADIIVSRTVLGDTAESLGWDEVETDKPFLASVRDFVMRTFMYLRFGSARETTAREEAIASLERHVEAEVLEDSGIVEITVTWSEPDVAKAIADEIARQFVLTSRELEAESTAATLEEIESGFAMREQAIATASQELAAFKEAHDIAADYDPVGPTGLDADVRGELNRLEAQLSAAEGDYDFWRDLYQGTQADGVTDGDRAQVLGEASTPVYPAGPDRLLYTVVGFLLGILFGLAAATWMELSNKTIYTADDVVNAVGGDVPVVVVGHSEDGEPQG